MGERLYVAINNHVDVETKIAFFKWLIQIPKAGPNSSNQMVSPGWYRTQDRGRTSEHLKQLAALIVIIPANA